MRLVGRNADVPPAAPPLYDGAAAAPSGAERGVDCRDAGRGAPLVAHPPVRCDERAGTELEAAATGAERTGVDGTLLGRRVIVLANQEQGTWAEKAVVPARKVVAIGEEGSAAQLAQLSINPVTAHTLLTRFGSLKPADWVGQTIGSGAAGQYVIRLARRAGYRTLSIVRSERAAEQVRAAGGDRVVVQGERLGTRIAEALDGRQLDLVLDGEGGETVGALDGRSHLSARRLPPGNRPRGLAGPIRQGALRLLTPDATVPAEPAARASEPTPCILVVVADSGVAASLTPVVRKMGTRTSAEGPVLRGSAPK